MYAAPFPPTISIASAHGAIAADLEQPVAPVGAVVITHEGRTSSVDRFIAANLVAAGFATLLYEPNHGTSLADAVRWLGDRLGVPVGIFAAGRGVAPARAVATEHPDLVRSLFVCEAHLEPAALDKLIDLAIGSFHRELGRAKSTTGRLWLG